MFMGTHYGIEVIVDYMDPEEDVLTQAIKSFEHWKIKYEILPIDVCLPHSNIPIFVFRYWKEEKEKFSIMNQEDNLYYTTEKLPVDLNIIELINDLNGQMRFGSKPKEMASKFLKLLDDAKSEARFQIEYGELSEENKQLMDIYSEIAQKKVEAEWEKRKRELESDDDFKDFGYDLPAEDLIYGRDIEELANSMLEMKMAADILNEKYYDYWEMKRLGDLDHHDKILQDGGYEYTLSVLHDSYFWREFLKDDLKKASK